MLELNDAEIAEWAACSDDEADTGILIHGPVVAAMARELIRSRERVKLVEARAELARVVLLGGHDDLLRPHLEGYGR